MASDWRGPINQLLYSLTFANAIHQEMITFNGGSAVQYTTLELGPDVYYQAIDRALASGEKLDAVSLLPQFDQAHIEDFLRGVSARLDELRPWPVPKTRRLDAGAWEKFKHARQIARLETSVVGVTDLLQKGFRDVGGFQPGMHVLMLRLRTGETVALLGAYGPGERVALLTDAANDPAEVIEHFVSATGFPADKITTI
jgi:hypothetical protein